ncbi:MAG: BamA/TamA family outer membrane protein [Lewinellaceae bacterium]|nr:BamA/TamA family outer membrane protein [Saprospiraceae bacterium]MCB9339833.1 BamA/TamA family outer membrane protein [Lewinellaceae bacterium]
MVRHFFQLFLIFFLTIPTLLTGQAPGPDTLAFATFQPSRSQKLEYAIIKNIYVAGNKHTKADIILRELDFSENDTVLLSTLTYRLQQNQYNLMNTGLFSSAEITFREWEGATNKVGLQITVRESWYIFPFPIVELADRNFNVWWETYNRSLRRLNLGVRFYHTNFTGRKDWLKAVAQFGFTKKFELIYTLPYFNKSGTIGLNFNALYTREKEIGYTTLGNRLLFQTDGDNILLRRLRLGAGLLYRQGLDTYHRLDASFHNNHIYESVQQELNPDFFLNGLRQQYLTLSYQFTLDKRDIKPYPINGFLFSTSLSEKGFGLSKGIQALDLSATYVQYIPIATRWNFVSFLKGKTGLNRSKQPYYNSTALGYEPDFLRGYEFYVVDGLDFVYQKSSLRYELFNSSINWGRLMIFDGLKIMPLKFYLVLHNELGYVNNPFYKTGNPLSNELLWGTSIGLDMVIYYNKVFNFEISRNHLGELGFFLHWAFSF